LYAVCVSVASSLCDAVSSPLLMLTGCVRVIAQTCVMILETQPACAALAC